MPEDRENEQEQVEITLFRELEKAKDALIQAVSLLDEANESPSAVESARAECRVAYQRYHEALQRFSTWVLGPKRENC